MRNEPAIYDMWLQPAWAPPAWLFGPVWTVLYIIIFITFSYVFVKVYQGELPKMIAVPFVINIVSNLAFTPIQFGLQSLPLAAIMILIVLGSLCWAMYVIYPYYSWITYALIPYALWVSFATVLQLTITYLNF